MRKHYRAALIGIFVVIALMVLTFTGVFTGFAVNDVGVGELDANFSFTREDALQALNESEEILAEMKRGGFSGVYVSDLLLEANNVFQQAEYADILRGNVDSTTFEENKARQALSLINWRNINYSDIRVYTIEIAETRDLAFLVSDLLVVQETVLGSKRDESGDIVSFSVEGVNLERFKFLINEVEAAIADSRYRDARILAEQLEDEVDIRRTETLTSIVFGKSFGSFLMENWYWILLVLIILSGGGYYLYIRVRKRFLGKKVQRMKTEARVLLSLMKKAQVERFKSNKVSKLVYEIRMKKYEERLQKIKGELPILEEELSGKKVKKGKAPVDKYKGKLIVGAGKSRKSKKV
ncbi:hypothetical protein HOA55_05300 [archaeon]|jgi:hypothetical protein|nr:hypothetical protein [archaeon]MBT3577738.1 hypothetical protein [archaeon]MBT6820745.1 hypothetical protein [archaeon]MBT6956422.1 hypothetical protein [archaeon]MBT7025885.1 hypothetical protein [archaeon]